MAKTWDIKGLRTVDNEDVEVVIATVHELEYHGEWMAEAFVTVSVKSPEPIDWHFDDYLEYRGEVFSINYDPNVVKKARRGTYGEGFTYDNIKLYFIGNKMKSVRFKDVVLNPESAANTQVYTSLSKFSFYAASVEDLADRLQANFDRSSLPLVQRFQVLTPSGTRTDQRLGQRPSVWYDYYTDQEDGGETDVEIQVEDQSCWDVLKFAYEKFGLSYFVSGQYVIIGCKALHVNTGSANIFRYGKGLGLYEIERTADESQDIVTKLFAYGSEQNLPLNYYANLYKKAYVTGEKFTFTQDGQTYYGVNTNVLYADVEDAIKTAEKIVTVTNSTGLVSCESETSFHTVTGTKYLRLDFVGEGAQAMYNAISNNETLYITSGVDKNTWPQNWIDTSGNYPACLSINRLMLPGFPRISLDEWVQDKIESTTGDEKIQWEAFYEKYLFSTTADDPWVKSRNSEVIGSIEGIVNFDGSSQQEIYPTIENTNSCVVFGADEITDNGYIDGTSIDFHIYVYRGEGYLDWKTALEMAMDSESVYMEMKSGYCVGRKFKVKNAKDSTYNSVAVWDLTCERDKDSSLERYFPYFDNDVSKYCQVRGVTGSYTGDTFVVTGIQMPDEYIEAASEKLLIAACGYLDKRDHVRYTYLPKIDEIFMARNQDEEEEDSYHDVIHAGMQLEFEDSDLGIWHSPYIDNLTIKENGNNGIPTYDVVLRDEKEKGALEKMADSIAELTANPPVQVVERLQRVLQYVEYPEWDPDGKYYFETLNTDTGVLETSKVWHNGILWMCKRTFTTEEPSWESQDWQYCGGGTFSLGFYDTDTPPTPIYGLSVRPASIDETVVPYLLVGQEDISSSATNWAWVRDSGNPELDAVWSGNHTGSLMRTLHLTTEDFPSGWAENGGRVMFTCTATFPYGDDNAQISNQITVV